MVHPSKFAEFHEEMFENVSKIVEIWDIPKILAVSTWSKLHLFGPQSCDIRFSAPIKIVRFTACLGEGC